MTTTLDVVVEETNASARLARRGKILWHATQPHGSGESPAATVAALLAQMPSMKRPRYRASIALGAAHCRIRRLEGLPPAKDLGALTRVVRENASSFFLRMPGGLAVAPLERRAEGAIWGAAFDHAVAVEVLRVARSAGAVDARVVPAAENTAFAWRPEPTRATVSRRARIRVGVAAGLFVCAAAIALVAPGLRATRTIRDAERESASLKQVGIEAARTRADLDRTTSVLQRVAEFRARRGKTTLLLGAIAQVLPESTALVSLRVDSAEGSFVALTPHAADVLPQLAGLTDLVAPRVVGSITRESMGAVQLERATIRFRRNVPVSKPKPVARRAAGTQ